MTEPFDAVLAEMRANSRFENGRWVHVAATGPELERWADRLAAAHAAEVAERDARIAELKRVAEDAINLAEAAERDARRFAWWFERGQVSSDALVELNLRVVNGDYPTLAEWRTAIDAAIVATEAAHEA